MRCDKLQQRVGEIGTEELSGAERQHFEACIGCQAYARDAAMLRSGLRLLAQESGPAPSWGFTARVLRRLNEIPARGLAASEFIENAGRQVMLATLILAVALFLAMILPSPGPLRHSQQPDAYWPSTQAAIEYYPAPVGGFPPVPAVVGVAREATFHR
ncbi:MAG: hypothetical protein ACRD22_17290 [Terriglobia bacterium]